MNKEGVDTRENVKTPPTAGSVREIESRLQPGTNLAGNFEIIEKIGEGGMAVVYVARQLSLNRNVAVKALHPRFAKDKSFVERFEAEAGALATLSHPNIISVIDRGNEGSIYFFIMEHMEGETLDQKIIENKLTFNDWRSVITSCRDALDYVHKRGVIHRDIKPSNILIDDEGRVKIGDFGIAHILAGDQQEPPEDSSNQPLGTAYYMAPEQTVSAQVDQRADIYSLGVAFYKMMTRQLPIGEYPAPSEANHDVPVAVDQVIYQAMALDPDDRYPTVRDFCDDLLKALKDKSVSITSILNYRTANPSSALYTGKEFASQSEVRKSKSEQAKKSKKASQGPHQAPSEKGGKAPSPPPAKKPQSMREGGVRASRDLTPLPVQEDLDPRRSSSSEKHSKPAEAGAPGDTEPKKKSGIMKVLVFFLLIAGLGAIFMVITQMGRDEAPVDVVPPPVTPVQQDQAISPALERQQRLERLLQEQNQEILNEEDGAATVRDQAAPQLRFAPGESQDANQGSTEQPNSPSQEQFPSP